MTYIVNIRNRRQITLPAEVLNKLRLSVGDNLALQVKEQKIIARPTKKFFKNLKCVKANFRNLEES
jgi:AbrB family looped-hinge helix DNA binding protein